MSDKPLLIVGEDLCQKLVRRAEAFDAVQDVFAAMARGDAYNFLVIREAIGYADASNPALPAPVRCWASSLAATGRGKWRKG